jgi:glycosyltransferase involved in cell wall biosynthesis
MTPEPVLFLVPRLPIGGSETFLMTLFEAFDRSRVRPVLFSMGTTEDPLYGRIPADIPKFVHARKWRFDLGPYETIGMIIRDFDIKTALCTDFFMYEYLRYTLRKEKLNLRVVILLHTTKPRYLKEFLHGAAFSLLLKGDEDIITTCQEQRGYLARIYRIPMRQMHTIIYNGIDTEFWRLPPPGFDRAGHRRKLGIPENALVILNVAGLRREKRHDIMVEAFASLPGDVRARSPYLLFVGGGDEAIRRQAVALAEKRGVGQNVIFAGVQSDLRSIYWLSDLFTLGSTSETLSIAALEAMASGLPSVLTDVGGAREMMPQGLSDLVVPAGEPLSLAAGWQECIRRLPQIDRTAIRENTVRTFSLKQCVTQYENFLNKQP